LTLKVMRHGRSFSVDATASATGLVSHAGGFLLVRVADNVRLGRARRFGAASLPPAWLRASALPRFVWRGRCRIEGERSVGVSDGICFVGLDVHARKTAGAAVHLGSGEVFRAQINGSPTAAIEWLQSLPGPVRAVYEAGPTGFGLARAARGAGIEMMVCSPGAIPRQPGDQVKTDARDALKLARLHAAGQLRPVLVPDRELEALRDLVRAREDLRGDLMAFRHRINKLLLRRGLIWEGPGTTWTKRHVEWLGSVRFHDPLGELVFGEYLACHQVLLARRERLEACWMIKPPIGGGRRWWRDCGACEASRP
jgi:hypothetical protein